MQKRLWCQQVAALLLVSLWLGSASGNIWPAPRERRVLSVNGKYCAKVIPQFAWKPQETRKTQDLRNLRERLKKRPKSAPGHCLIRVYRNAEKKLTLLWERNLVNDWSPTRVIISNSGKHVVTVGDWYKHQLLPIVIYGERGELIKYHGKESLGLQDDECLRKGRTPFHDNSLMFYGPGMIGGCLYVRLSSGKFLIIGLQNGVLADGTLKLDGEKKTLREYAQEKARQIALSLSRSKDKKERERGKALCKQMKVPTEETSKKRLDARRGRRETSSRGIEPKQRLEKQPPAADPDN